MASQVSKWRQHFAGYDDEFLDWSWHMAYYFSQRDYDKDKQFNVAISCFTGYARTWWNQFEDDRWYRRRPPVKTWVQLVFVMTRHFAPEIDARSYTKTIQHRSGPRPLVPTESYTVRSSRPLECRSERRVTRCHPSVPASSGHPTTPAQVFDCSIVLTLPNLHGHDDQVPLESSPSSSTATSCEFNKGLGNGSVSNSGHQKGGIGETSSPILPSTQPAEVAQVQ